MGNRRDQAVEKFEKKNADLYEALRDVGHELHTFVIASEVGGPVAKVGCTKCRKEWLGKRAQSRGRGLTPNIPCPGPVPDPSLYGRLQRRFGKSED